MPHALITGTSTCGKSTLAKALAYRWRIKGAKVLILDPMGTVWPMATWRPYFTPHAFFAHIKREQSCAVFADEAWNKIGRNKDFDELATMMRHDGHEVHFLTQAPRQLLPTIRENCEHLYCFKLSKRSAVMLAEDFVTPEIEEIVPKLEQYQFLYTTRFKKPVICELYIVDGQRVPSIRKISA